MGFGIDFRLTLLALLALQVTWTAFCVIRFIQLRMDGGHKQDAPLYDRESYGFALGGSISSVALLVVMVVLTQAPSRTRNGEPLLQHSALRASDQSGEEMSHG
jgi:hypothetical protein